MPIEKAKLSPLTKSIMQIMKHFIFGYGSLMCPQSRSVTAPNLESIAEPVVITGIERTWSARVTKAQAHSSTGEDSNEAPPANNDRSHIRGWTPMGVRFRSGAKCNGILLHVDDEELMRFDVREAGYVRQRIDLADIHRHIDSDKLVDANMSLWPTGSSTSAEEINDDEEEIDSQILEHVKCSKCRWVFEKAIEKRKQSSSEDGSTLEDEHDIAVWVYVQSENYPAERSFPITQSYVDIIMRGCLSISRDFAKLFLETTHGWWHDGDHDKEVVDQTVLDIDKHHTWVNDRHKPMYVRADSEYSLQNGSEIDELIKEHHPHALKRRVMSM